MTCKQCEPLSVKFESSVPSDAKFCTEKDNSMFFLKFAVVALIFSISMMGTQVFASIQGGNVSDVSCNIEGTWPTGQNYREQIILQPKKGYWDVSRSFELPYKYDDQMDWAQRVTGGEYPAGVGELEQFIEGNKIVKHVFQLSKKSIQEISFIEVFTFRRYDIGSDNSYWGTLVVLRGVEPFGKMPKQELFKALIDYDDIARTTICK
jgi:hypothetical protein